MPVLQPFDQRDGFIWQDGKLQPWNESLVHVLNHGLHYGSCVFEGLRVYNRKIFKLNEHTERLHRSAEMLGFTVPYSVQEINDACNQVVAAQKIIDGYVRPVCWLGSEAMTIYSPASKSHAAVAAWEWPAYYGKEKLTKGVRLCFAKWKRPSPETAPVASKAAGLYMICTSAKREAAQRGCDDALMLDYRGYLAEATSANLFLVFNGELHTPTADCFLNGITRQTVMQLARDLGIIVTERHIRPEELKDAQEMFLTGTAAEITAVGEVEGAAVFKTPGEVTERLREAYQAETLK